MITSFHTDIVSRNSVNRLSLAKGGIAARWEDVLFFELVAPAEQPATEKPEKPRWVQPELF